VRELFLRHAKLLTQASNQVSRVLFHRILPLLGLPEEAWRGETGSK